MAKEIEPTLAPYIVTCQTEGCENQNITLGIDADAENPTVICGPCGQLITAIAHA